MTTFREHDPFYLPEHERVTCLHFALFLSFSPSSHISQRDAISVLLSAPVTRNKEATRWVMSQMGSVFYFFQLDPKVTRYDKEEKKKIQRNILMAVKMQERLCYRALKCPRRDMC